MSRRLCGGVGGPCDYCVSPSPFGLDFGTLDLGLTIRHLAILILKIPSQGNQRKLLDTSLGFAAGVMLAASYWSLLEPALEMGAGMGSYGEEGEWAFIPVSVGILLGAGFVYAGMMVLNMTFSTKHLSY